MDRLFFCRRPSDSGRLGGTPTTPNTKLVTIFHVLNGVILLLLMFAI